MATITESIDTKIKPNCRKTIKVSGKLNTVISGIENGQDSLGKLTKTSALYNLKRNFPNSLNLP